MKPNLIPTKLDNDGLTNAIIEGPYRTDYNASYIIKTIRDRSDALQLEEPLTIIPLPVKQNEESNLGTVWKC